MGCKMCRVLLSEALDLCVRAQSLDRQADMALQAGHGEMRCGTPALWVQDQYVTDLSTWETRTRAFLIDPDCEHKERDDD